MQMLELMLQGRFIGMLYLIAASSLRQLAWEAQRRYIGNRDDYVVHQWAGGSAR